MGSELLKQITPGVTHAAVLRDPSNPNAAIQTLAQLLKIEVTPVDARNELPPSHH
jgi:hypothetical protein